MLERLATAVTLSIVASAPAASAQVASPAPSDIAVGDWLLDPVLEVRARAEYRHDLDGADRAILVERSRLGVDASRGAVELRVVLQDARVLEPTGSAPVEGPPPVALAGAYEGWAEVHTASDRPSFLRVGRQPIVWGEGRLLGASDWSPTGRTLDAVRGRLAAGDGALELLAAVLEDQARATSFSIIPYGELFGARGQWAFDPLFGVEIDALARLAQASPTLGSVEPAGAAADAGEAVQGRTFAAASRLHGDHEGWTWGLEGALELGDVDGAPRGQAQFSGPRAAWAAAARVARTFTDAVLQPELGLGAAYASGDRGGRTYGGFDPLLPDVHEWHGAMDAFAWANEAEASVHLAAAPWTDGVLSVDYRYARLAQPGGLWQSAYLLTIGQATDNARSSLGHEIDAALGWSPWAAVRLEAGYSVLFLGDGAKTILRAVDKTVPSASDYAFADARFDL